MKYEEGVLFIQEIFNEVLISLDEKPLFENEHFYINKELHFEHFIQLRLIKKNVCGVLIEISTTELRIDIDRAEEIFHMNINYIKNNRVEVTKIIQMIFTSMIMIEYCGDFYTKLFFIKNTFVKSIVHRSSLISFRINCKEKFYPAIFP